MTERPRTIAERRFEEEAEALAKLDMAQRFERMYETNLWSGTESKSGVGSSLAATRILRAELPPLLRSLGVRRLLDVPCGDFHWMRHVDLAGIEYIGGDIVAAAIEANRAAWESPSRRFVLLDITADRLPEADAIFCRDLLVHFSFETIGRAFANMRASGADYLLATDFPGRGANADIVDGDWRPLDLQATPFRLPAPIATIVEGCEEENGAYADKSIGVWRISDLPATFDVSR